MNSYCNTCGIWGELDRYTFRCPACTRAWFAAHIVDGKLHMLRYENASTSDRPFYTLDPDDGEH